MLPIIEKLQKFYTAELINSKNLIQILQTSIIQSIKDLIAIQEITVREKIDICKKLEFEKKRNGKLCESNKEKY